MGIRGPFRLSARRARDSLPLLLAVFVSLLAGCSQTGGSCCDPSGPEGTYALSSIGGASLPCTPPHEGGAPEVRSGAIRLNADGTFTSTMAYGFPDGREGGRDFRGTWTREGVSFVLRWEGAGVTTATLDGDTLTMDNEGFAFVYRR